MGRKYLTNHHLIKVGEVYKNDFGKVKVITKLDDSCFEVEFLSKPYNVSKSFVVYKNGRFGNCWNNPHTLCNL